MNKNLSDMELSSHNISQNDLDFYHEMLDKYQNDIGMLVTWAGSFGDVKLLNKMAISGQYNPLHITPVEQWNYLHKCNIGSPYPISTVKFYLNYGVPVNAQDRKGYTPLHFAMRAQNGDAALVLLEAGADPNIPNRDNTVPLAMIGGMRDRLDVLEKMLQCGGNVHYKSGNSGLSILGVLHTYRSGQEEWQPIIDLMEKYACFNTD